VLVSLRVVLSPFLIGFFEFGTKLYHPDLDAMLRLYKFCSFVPDTAIHSCRSDPARELIQEVVFDCTMCDYVE
jgi:hypothetical protein